MRDSRRRLRLQVEVVETRVVLSALMIAPAMRVAGAPSADIERAIAASLAVSRDTVQIHNKTSYEIEVTARLMVPGPNKPTISRRIGRGGTATFAFGRNTNDFIGIEVRRVGGTSPPPFAVTLNRPLGGYDGKLFTVSEFGGRFAVGG